MPATPGRKLNSREKWSLLFLVGIFLLLVWWVWAEQSADVARRISASATGSLSDAANWGESFGALNALISTVGLGFVIATIWLQARTLTEQRADLHRQRFESSFFEILKFIRAYRDDFEYKFSPEIMNEYKTHSGHNLDIKIHRGDESFRAAAIELFLWLKYKGSIAAPELRDVQKYYDQHVHGRAEVVLGPYFRLIYTILYRIKNDTFLSDEEKVQYANLLRSQLSTSEVTLLCINGLSNVSKDLDELITEFRMLKYMRLTGIGRRLADLYPPEASAARS